MANDPIPAASDGAGLVMGSAFDSQAEHIAFLEGKVEALEAALEARSRLLRQLQTYADADTLLLISRLTRGLPPLPDRAYELDLWKETTRFTKADVDTTMRDLWRSLTPPDDPPPHDPDEPA